MAAIFALWAAFLLPACKSADDRLLDHAEMIMQQHPDSARMLLESITPDRLNSEKRMARHTILLAEARYKTFEDDTASSDISKAADYYDDDVKNLYRLKAYFFKSKILNNAGKEGEALVNFMNAEKSANELNDTVWLGRIHGEMGRSFATLNNPAASIPWLEKSVDEFNAIHEDYFIADYIQTLATEYYNSALSSDSRRDSLFEKSIRQARILTDFARRNNEPDFLYRGMHIIADSYMRKYQYGDAKPILEKIRDINPKYMEASDYVDLGEIYLNYNNIAGAKACEDSVERLDPHRMSLKAMIAYKEGDYKSAYDFLLLNQRNNRNIYQQWLKRDQTKIIFDNYRLSDYNAGLVIKNKNLQIGILCCIMALFGIAGYVAYRISRKERLKILRQSEDFREIISSLKEKYAEVNPTKGNTDGNADSLDTDTKTGADAASIDDRAGAIEEVTEVLKDALSHHYEVLDSITSRFYEVKQTPGKQSQLYKVIEDMISSVQKDDRIIGKMVAIVDRHLGGLMSSLKTDCPKITTNDYRIYLFTVLGFSAKSISVFENIDIDKVYNRKYSLKKKLEKLPQNIREKYLRHIR